MAKVIEIVGEAAEVIADNPTSTFELVEVVAEKSLVGKRAALVVAASVVTIGTIFVISRVKAKKAKDALAVAENDTPAAPEAE